MILNYLETENRDLLPNYFYRDDAISLWNIMTKYVKGVITFYYKSENVRMRCNTIIYCFSESISFSMVIEVTPVSA